MNSLTPKQVITSWLGQQPKWGIYQPGPFHDFLLKYLQELMDAGLIFTEVPKGQEQFTGTCAGFVRGELGGKPVVVRVFALKTVRVLEAHIQKGRVFYEVVTLRTEEATEVSKYNDILSAIVGQ